QCKSELQTKRKLNQPWVHRRGRDHAEQRIIYQEPPSIDLSRGARRVRELRMIEDIEEFCSELEVLLLANSGHLGSREVRIELSRAQNDTNTGIAPIRRSIIPNRARSTERGTIEETSNRRAGCATEPILHAALRENVIVCFAGTKLRGTRTLFDRTGVPPEINRSTTAILQRERGSLLGQCQPRYRPSLNQLSEGAFCLERQFILVTHDEPVRPAIWRRTILPLHIVRVINIRRSEAHV